MRNLSRTVADIQSSMLLPPLCSSFYAVKIVSMQSEWNCSCRWEFKVHTNIRPMWSDQPIWARALVLLRLFFSWTNGHVYCLGKGCKANSLRCHRGELWCMFFKLASWNRDRRTNYSYAHAHFFSLSSSSAGTNRSKGGSEKLVIWQIYYSFLTGIDKLLHKYLLGTQVEKVSHSK